MSNLLSNGFGESLERLIRSYVQQRGHGPLNWNLDAAMHPSNGPNANQEQERNPETQQFQAPVNRPALVIPPPPLPPRQPLWHRELRHNNWNSRHRVHADPMLSSHSIMELLYRRRKNFLTSALSQKKSNIFGSVFLAGMGCY